ncbi:BTB/POZ domain-containing protein At3g50780-like isoform X1 [Papaver somniferum]|uniref:BTB/POZ domain-containing protein At3g50780-like isoform X1 n=2 Tax=Papaver somniferum TaxID=3469 RepID=UPI000E70486F|nr:BTB/POZ domain-containing protein At3g50780-like isoform X1 [Papaver somniferum]
MAALYEANTTASEITPKIPAIEISILVFVYIIPFLNRLSLLSKFPVLRLAMNPVLAMLRFYQLIPTLGLIGFLALFIGFLRYRGRNLSKLDSLQAMIMDCLVVVASLIRPFLLNTDPLARGAALGFKFQLLSVLELLTFQTCIHACLKYLEAVPWIVARPSINTLEHIIGVVLKTDGYEGRRAGKSFVVELLRSRDCLLSDVNSAETYNKSILSSCQRCVDSLLKLFKKAADTGFEVSYLCKTLDNQIYLEVDNLLWLFDILVDRQAAEEFALMWAKQQKLADLHTKFWTPSRRFISCITVRLLVGIGKVEILLTEDTRQLLLLTWVQPLVDDYAYL